MFILAIFTAYLTDMVDHSINTQPMTTKRKCTEIQEIKKRFRHTTNGYTTKTTENGIISKKGKYTSPKKANRLYHLMGQRVLHVWEGYRKECPNNPVFVFVLPNNGTSLSLEDLPKSYHENECVFRHEYEVNKEACTITSSPKSRKILIGRKERIELKNTVEQNINQLLKDHANIEMIGVSSVRSKNYGPQDTKLIRETCIVLYVHVKGVIPIGEEEFPRRIGNFPIDVREGKFIPYGRVPGANEYHQRLLTGCQIVRQTAKSFGTIGGFLDLPGGGIGVLTCAHVVLTDKECEQFINCRPEQQTDLRKSVPWRTLQICQPDHYNDFGTVKDFVLYPGSSSDVGIDAAVVKINNEARLPVSGEFPWDEKQITGYGPDNPMEFLSGNCIEIKPELEGCEVVKFGAATGITRGLLAHRSLFVKRSHVPNLAFKDVMYNQMEIQPLQGFDGFAQKGDSGSLVLMAHKGNRTKLVAVGMVVGGTTFNTTVVTPILNILKEFNLPNMCLKTFRHCPWPKETSSLAELKKEQNKQGKEIKQLKQNIQEYRKDHKKQAQQQRKESQKIISLIKGLKRDNARNRQDDQKH
ncbi:hypothetical protein ACJMK2_001137 [Sinanodonta woodiana]|uniref:Peptidase S1 domain-containing protein n=1 Tax=Sinanodonta woodiana TaxID=1069815 RepID=A0ABD3XRU0_SINWO